MNYTQAEARVLAAPHPDETYGERVGRHIKWLDYAATHGDVELADVLIAEGADIGHNDNYFIQIAAQHGHDDVVEALADAGADVRATSNLALRWAVQKKRGSTVSLLLAKGAGVGGIPSGLLELAAQQDDLATVTALLPYIAQDVVQLRRALACVLPSTSDNAWLIIKALAKAIHLF